MWIHGGAWIAGSKEGISNFLRVIAGEGYTTIAVEYGTGYGTAYPVPVEQVNDALGWLVAHAAELGIDPDRIVLAGDSAGAQIAAQVANLTTDRGYAEQLGIVARLRPEDIKGVMLLSGPMTSRASSSTVPTDGSCAPCSGPIRAYVISCRMNGSAWPPSPNM